MITYFLQLSAYSLLFYGMYLLLLKWQPYALLSRVFLWATIILPFILPFARFTWSGSVGILPSGPIMRYLPEVTFQPYATPASVISWRDLSLMVYAGIVAVLFLKNGMQWFRFRKQLLLAEKIRVDDQEIAILPQQGPGSFGKNIFFPDYDITLPVLRHEQAHVAQKHYLDLLILRLIRIFCWPHFLLYFLEKELRLTHEYAADRAAVPEDNHSYAQLLLSQTFDTHHPFVPTFFHHPIKQRIIMLQQEIKTKTGRRLRLKSGLSIALLSAVIVFAQCGNKHELEFGKAESTTFSAIATPVEKSKPEMTNQATQAKQTLDSYNREVRENRTPTTEAGIIPQAMLDSPIVYKYVEYMPEFVGDVSAWLRENLKYPESAYKENKSGRVITQFVVSENGMVKDAVVVKSSDVPELDEEALRVINTMPAWKPGKQSGKTVAVYYTLPINFQLGK